MSTIPASHDVAIVPSVIGGGGAALNLSGLVLTANTRVPIGSILSFPNAPSVATFFGPTATEADAALKYFAGFDTSTVKPAAMLFSQYNAAAVAGYLRGGNISAMPLATLQGLIGTIILTVAGTVFTSATINLSTATSFSTAATLIQAGFTSPTFTVTYDSVSGAFLFTNTATGAISTITFATGTISTALMLTSATGAVLSQGAAATTPAVAMAAIVNQMTNFVSFMTMFDPDATGNTLKQAFATWNATNGTRYAYVCWDVDPTVRTTNPSTTCLGQLLKASNTSGTILISESDYTKAAFVCGMIASINTAQTNGRITMKFKYQSGLPAGVTDLLTASNIEANGYNYYGSYATAAQGFVYYSPGSISGVYLNADAYIDQVWLDNSLQLAVMTLMTQVNSVPYDANGTALIRSACQGPINDALNFGMMSPGVAMSTLQISEVNTAAGLAIDKSLAANGFYLQILPATAAIRAQRGSPPINLWYLDAGAVHKISIASIAVQ